jgi:uncharacterized protein
MTAQWLAGLTLTALVGGSLGIFGAGGSIVMLPVLVYVMGIEPHAAVPLSLAIVGSTSVVGVAAHARSGDIDWGTAGFFGVAAIAGGYVGSRVSPLVPASLLLLSFGLLLLIVGFRMWHLSVSDGGTRTRRPTLMLAAGSVVGVLTGFLGVGGGFLIVPALSKVGGLNMHRAIKTSLVVIAMSSLAALGAHLIQGNSVASEVGVPLTLAALLGMAAGQRAALYVEGEHLRRGFAGFVTTVGVVLVLANSLGVWRLFERSR